ncbi:MAG: YchJ family protein [Rhabdochlamydiaceae bacterium]
MMCPCYSGKSYDQCCGPYHAGKLVPTPLALMRSRYSGYALKKIDYILETTHPTLQKQSKEREEIAKFSDEVSFDGLDILEAVGDYVTFRAHLLKKGKDISFTEKSHFVKVNGTWKYHSGVLTSSVLGSFSSLP